MLEIARWREKIKNVWKSGRMKKRVSEREIVCVCERERVCVCV